MKAEDKSRIEQRKKAYFAGEIKCIKGKEKYLILATIWSHLKGEHKLCLIYFTVKSKPVRFPVFHTRQCKCIQHQQVALSAQMRKSTTEDLPQTVWLLRPTPAGHMTPLHCKTAFIFRNNLHFIQIWSNKNVQKERWREIRASKSS